MCVGNKNVIPVQCYKLDMKGTDVDNNRTQCKLFVAGHNDTGS